MLYNLHTHRFSNNNEVFEIVNQYPAEFDSTIPYYSIGIHPWYINKEKESLDLDIIEEKFQQKNCLALGECGLDKRIDFPIVDQIEIFEKQLLLANKYKKPVILHCVSAYQEVIEIKNRLKIEVSMIIHGFSKNSQVAKLLLDNGLYLSFGKYLLRNPELAVVFENVPNDKFLLETDTIDESISEVYKKASDIKNINIKEQVEVNFKKIFKF